MNGDMLKEAIELNASKSIAENILRIKPMVLMGETRELFKFSESIFLNERISEAIHIAIEHELEAINKEIQDL